MELQSSPPLPRPVADEAPAADARQRALTLAHRARNFAHMSVTDELADLAPHLPPAERTDRLAALIDAVTFRDAVQGVARAEPWEAADHLHRINPDHVPATEATAHTSLIAAARTRRAIALRNFDAIAGLDKDVDGALTKLLAAANPDGTDADHDADDREAEAANPGTRLRVAEEELNAALGDLSFRTQHRLRTALSELVDAAQARLDSALAPFAGGAR